MWKTIKTEVLIEDYHVTVRKDRVEIPDGTVINNFYTVTIPDAAMVCALTAGRKAGKHKQAHQPDAPVSGKELRENQRSASGCE